MQLNNYQKICFNQVSETGNYLHLAKCKADMFDSPH